MIKLLKISIAGFLFVTLLGFSPGFLAGPSIVHACGNTCGWGSGTSGGGDYVPQVRNQMGPVAQNSFLTKEQAGDIANYHVKKLNSDLEIGQIKDAGGFYDIEIVDGDKNIVQHLGVDKQSCRLIEIK